MAIYDNLPYANFHELNLDWILKQVKEDADYLNSIKAQLDLIQANLEDFEAKYPAIAAIAGSNAGNSKNFIYFVDGVPTATTETMGDTQQPLYLDGGTLKTGSVFGRIWGPSASPTPDPSTYHKGDVWIQYKDEVVTPPNITHKIMRFSLRGASNWSELFALDLTDGAVLPEVS